MKIQLHRSILKNQGSRKASRTRISSLVLSVILLLILLFVILLNKNLQDRIVYALHSVIPFEQYRLDSPYYSDLSSFYTDKNSIRREVDAVFLGDSHVEYFNTAEIHIVTIENLGIRGDTTRGILERHTENLGNLEYQMVVLHIGANDMKFRSNDEILLNLVDILEEFKESRIILQSLFPLNGKRRFFNRRIEALNSSMESLCAESGIEYLDLYPEFLSDDGTGLSSALSRDGTHLNQAGYRKWYQELSAYFD